MNHDIKQNKEDKKEKEVLWIDMNETKKPAKKPRLSSQ